MARRSAVLVILALLAASPSAAAAKDARVKLALPNAGDASLYVVALKGAGAKLPKLKATGPAGVVVVGGVKRDPRNRRDALASVAIVRPKPPAGVARAAQSADALALVFVGYHRALKGKLPGAAANVVQTAVAKAALRSACKRRIGVFAYAIDSLRPKRLLGNLFGGIAAPALMTYVNHEACDRAYPEQGKFKGDIDPPAPGGGCPAPRVAFVLFQGTCPAPGGGPTPQDDATAVEQEGGYDHRRGPGMGFPSSACGRVSTNPPRPGAQFESILFKNTTQLSAPFKGTLDDAGRGFPQFGIDQGGSGSPTYVIRTTVILPSGRSFGDESPAFDAPFGPDHTQDCPGPYASTTPGR